MNNAAWFGKITRRLFLVFLLFALVPTTVLTFLSLRYVSSEATRQVNLLQDEQASILVDLLLGRLVAISEQLKLFVEDADLGDLSGTTASTFSTLPLAALDRAQGLKARATALEHLRSGRPLLLIIPQEGNRPGVFMVMALDPGDLQRGLAAVQLQDEMVLGDEESRDLRQEHCIYDEQAKILFATNRQVCAVFAGLNAYQDSYRGLATGVGDGVEYLAGYKSIFLGSVYSAHDWRGTVVKPSAEIFAAADEFRRLFFSLAILVVLSISLASIYLIRRQMSPLGEIMEGIKRVTQKDYSTSVSVDSGDEFEDLAVAFNTMSQRVSHQLLTQASMSEIDQLILSRVKKEDIIRIVLEQTREVLPADDIAMVLLDGESLAAQVYRLSESFTGELSSIAVEVNKEELAQFEGSDYLLVDAAAEPPSYIAATTMSASSGFEVVSVQQEDKLIGLMVLAYQEDPELEQDDLLLAQNYADRIAVALANAEWEDKLYRQAHYDALTGLPNRMSFLDRLGQNINRAQRQDESLGILFIDLDNFKLVNDTLGHPVGDRFIKLLSERFKECLRSEDSVARLGGDEFVITAAGSADHALTVASLSQIANRILEAAARPVNIEGHDIRASASVGIALYPRDGEDADALLKNADTAMYHAKSLGRGKFQFYSSDLNEQLMELMRLSTDIRAALEKDEFELHYQPKVDTFSRNIVGAEALVRWQHPQRGMVRPDEFIEAAEGLGLISAIGDWTLEAACKQLRAWKDAGVATVRVAVNVSAVQLQQDDMYAKVRGLLKAYALHGSDLELEITENLLVQDMESAVTVLDQVRSLGVHVSIDDYGTGYSSLSYMKELPVDTLKIDRCFITDLCEDMADQAIVNSTIVLARNLEMKVLAEGVETDGQMQLLQNYGCDEIQGYYFSPPVPDQDFKAMLCSADPFEQEKLGGKSAS